MFASGKGRKAAYRVSTREELTKMRLVDRDGIEAFVWSTIYRDGPLSVERVLELTRLRLRLEVPSGTLEQQMSACRDNPDGDLAQLRALLAK